MSPTRTVHNILLLVSKRSPRHLGGRVAVLVAATLCLGAAVNTLRPTGGLAWTYDWNRHLEQEALKAGLTLADRGTVAAAVRDSLPLLLDARARKEYDQGHLPGAVSLPHRDLESVYPEVELLLVPEEPLIVYCAGITCDDALRLALFIQKQGFSGATLYAGGWSDWVAADGAVEGGPR